MTSILLLNFRIKNISHYVSTLVHHMNVKTIMFTNLCFHWDRPFQHSIMLCKINQCSQRYKELEIVKGIISTINADLEFNNTIPYDASTRILHTKLVELMLIRELIKLLFLSKACQIPINDRRITTPNQDYSLCNHLFSISAFPDMHQSNLCVSGSLKEILKPLN